MDPEIMIEAKDPARSVFLVSFFIDILLFHKVLINYEDESLDEIK